MSSSSAANDVIEQFTSSINKNETVEVVRELFDAKKIRQITDLSGDEIKLCTAILGVAKARQLESWADIVDIYATLMLSHKRKSRREVVEAVVGYEKLKRLMSGGGVFGGRQNNQARLY